MNTLKHGDRGIGQGKGTACGAESRREVEIDER
jgi:hypothetical protein